MADPSPTAGTLTTWQHTSHSSVKRILVDFITHASAGTFTLPVSEALDGQLLGLIAFPTDLTDLYDVILTDDLTNSDADFLNGAGANLAASPTDGFEWKALELAVGGPGIPVFCPSWTLKVTNAGNSKTGQFQLYYR